MIENIIHFKEIHWEKLQDGVEQKTHTVGNRRLRLLRLHDTFQEHDWCLNGHVGFVLKGEMIIDFDGTIKKYKEGDGLWIGEGENHKHKARIDKGKHIELILFESIFNQQES